MSRRTRNRSLLLLGVLAAGVGGFVLVGHQQPASADVAQAGAAESTNTEAPTTHKERKKAAEEALLNRTEKARKRLEKLQKQMAKEGNDELAARMAQKLADMDELKREHEDKLAELEGE